MPASSVTGSASSAPTEADNIGGGVRIIVNTIADLTGLEPADPPGSAGSLLGALNWQNFATPIPNRLGPTGAAVNPVMGDMAATDP